MTKPNLHVAIAILVHNNNVLVGWRNADQHQGNKYEFPGGKVEEQESPVQACQREVKEEVGIDINQWKKFDFIRHEYDDVIVHLHFFMAHVAVELAETIEKPWQWYSRNQLLDLNFPKANTAIVKKLYWQKFIKITDDFSALNNIENDRLIYLRVDATEEVRREISQVSVEALSKVILNIDVWNNLNELQKRSVTTLHIKQHQLNTLTKDNLDVTKRYIASCHDLDSVLKAEQLGCDAVLLSPVLETPTHPEAEGLGWKEFADIAKQSKVLVFGLGGLSPNDLKKAIEHYAYGVAGIRNF
jgi:8-oxo-dGTP diphosphatase